MAHWNVNAWGAFNIGTLVEFHGAGASTKISTGDTFSGADHAGHPVTGAVLIVTGNDAELGVGSNVVSVRHVAAQNNMPMPQTWKVIGIR